MNDMGIGHKAVQATADTYNDPAVAALRDVLGFLMSRECPHAPGPYASSCGGMVEAAEYIQHEIERRAAGIVAPPQVDRWQCPFCDDPLIDHPKRECTEAARRGVEDTRHERTGE